MLVVGTVVAISVASALALSGGACCARRWWLRRKQSKETQRRFAFMTYAPVGTVEVDYI